MRARTRNALPELLVLLLALFTRLWGLDYHSLWFDESVSMIWASSGPGYTWESTFGLVKDKHPPVYYLLLHFWRELLKPFGLGSNDAALRLLGSLLGVLTVLGVLVLVKRLSGRPTSLLAGALVALSPALVWYSQELRMFQPATTALVWAACCLMMATRTVQRGRRIWWWVAMVATFTLALYSYLFAAFMLPAAGVVLLGVLWGWYRERGERGERNGAERDDRSAGVLACPSGLTIFLEGAAALILTGLIFLPLARNAWLANANDGTPGTAFMNFSANMVRQLQVATVWRVDWAAPGVTAALAVLAALLLVGLVIPWRSATGGTGSRAKRDEADEREAQVPAVPPSENEQLRLAQAAAPALRSGDRLYLWAWLGMPLLVGNLLLARNDTVFAEDRYFLFLAPFALWAVARGAVALGERWRPAGWLAGAAAVILLAAALPRLWTPGMLREDWRAAANYIADYQDGSPGLPGAVVAHIDYTRTPLNWYLGKRYSRDKLPVFFPYGGKLSPDEVDQVVAPPLQGIAADGAATLWLTQSHLEGVDDAHLVEGWLNQNYPLVTEQYPTGVKLTGYALQHQFAELPELAANAVRPAAELAPNLLLAACEIVTPEVAAQDERMHPPSGWVHVRLWWQAQGQVDGDYVATVRMVGPEGVWGDRLYRDNETLRRWPTSSWANADYMRDEVDVNLNPVTPPGTYPIVVGVMDGQGQETGKTVECGRVEVR
ncbi:MAG: glycosyltransferase family 39 protein [Caldilineaceae bacterium]